MEGEPPIGKQQSLTNFGRSLTNLDLKQIWAPTRPLLVTKLSTGCSDKLFFPRANNQKMPKLDLPVGKKVGGVKKD